MRFGGRIPESDFERPLESDLPHDPDEDVHRLERLGLFDPPGPATSCCCVAPAQVRVLLPVPGDPDRLIDVLLCGHHYRLHAQELNRRNACVLDANERAVRRPRATTAVAPS